MPATSATASTPRWSRAATTIMVLTARFGRVEEPERAAPRRLYRGNRIRAMRSSTPVKRTAARPLQAQNAACAIAADGRVVVYLGDDERGEFLLHSGSRATSTCRAATPRRCSKRACFMCQVQRRPDRQLELRFSEDNTGMSAAEIAIFHPHGGVEGRRDHHGPSGMGGGQPGVDRGLLLPHTNNSRRGVKNEDGSDAHPMPVADAMTVNAESTRARRMAYGQIVAGAGPARPCRQCASNGTSTQWPAIGVHAEGPWRDRPTSTPAICSTHPTAMGDRFHPA